MKKSTWKIIAEVLKALLALLTGLGVGSVLF